jgi:type II secretory pathway pseudopilin PulG
VPNQKAAPPSSKARTRAPITTVLLILALLCASVSASADTLHVSHVHYLPSSGAISLNVLADGPLDTSVAANLYRHHCPSQPAETDVKPGVVADGETHEILANPPQSQATGHFKVCVWTIHPDQSIGAVYEGPAKLPAPRHTKHAPNNAAAREEQEDREHRRTQPTDDPATNKTSLWVVIVLLGTLALIALALARQIINAVRRRRTKASEQHTLSAWQQAAENTASTPATATATPTAAGAATATHTSPPPAPSEQPQPPVRDYPFTPPQAPEPPTVELTPTDHPDSDSADAENPGKDTH